MSDSGGLTTISAFVQAFFHMPDAVDDRLENRAEACVGQNERIQDDRRSVKREVECLGCCSLQVIGRSQVRLDRL